VRIPFDRNYYLIIKNAHGNASMLESEGNKNVSSPKDPALSMLASPYRLDKYRKHLDLFL